MFTLLKYSLLLHLIHSYQHTTMKIGLPCQDHCLRMINHPDNLKSLSIEAWGRNGADGLTYKVYLM